MIRQIEIANFQSLRKLSVRLGRFTAITGPTGSGKSGLIRAVRLVAFNARGTDYITRGEKTCTVSLAGDEIELTGIEDDRWQAVIRRGGKDSYQLAVGINQKTYTKLQGKVPDPVTEVLRLGEINFAGQWGQPYLLDSTGSEVARVLGRLTNVTLLYRAAQEANRRRLAAAQLLRTRQSDLAQLEEQAKQYASLPQEGAAVQAAEAALDRMQAASQRRDRLRELTDTHQRMSGVLGSIAIPAPAPSLARLESLAARRSQFAERCRAADRANLALRAAQAAEADAVAAAESARTELQSYEAQWDICPTCGQPVHRTPH